MDELFELIWRMAPEEALSKITPVLARLIADLDPSGMNRKYPAITATRKPPELPETAGMTSITSNNRRLVVKWHPDK